LSPLEVGLEVAQIYRGFHHQTCIEHLSALHMLANLDLQGNGEYTLVHGTECADRAGHTLGHLSYSFKEHQPIPKRSHSSVTRG
jgi:hypothetical protein